MAENFPNLKENDIKIREVQKTLTKLNTNRSTPRHIIIKMAKVNDKERILKAAGEINEIETKKIMEKISEMKSQFFEKINKIDKPLAKLIKKRERTQINKIRK